MHYEIINDKVVEKTGAKLPNSLSGLAHIIGARTENDRKWVMKVDPSLVKEKIQGMESDNLGRSPIMMYEFAHDLGKRAKQFDVWIINGICFILGACAAASLYFWHIIEIFAK